MLLAVGLQDPPLRAAGPDGVLVGVLTSLHTLLALSLQERSAQPAQSQFSRLDIPGWTPGLNLELGGAGDF